MARHGPLTSSTTPTKDCLFRASSLLCLLQEDLNLTSVSRPCFEYSVNSPEGLNSFSFPSLCVSQILTFPGFLFVSVWRLPWSWEESDTDWRIGDLSDNQLAPSVGRALQKATLPFHQSTLCLCCISASAQKWEKIRPGCHVWKTFPYTENTDC